MAIPAVRAAAASTARSPLPPLDRGQQIDPGVTRKRIGDRQPFRRGKRIDGLVPKTKFLCAGSACRLRQNRRAIIHQQLITLIRPIPFQHCEFRMMQRAALAIAEYARKIDNPQSHPLPAVFCRRIPAKCADISALSFAARTDQVGGEGMQVCLVARRNLKRRRLDLEKIPLRKPCPQGRRDAGARQQVRSAGRVGAGAPERRDFGTFTSTGRRARKAGIGREDRYGAARNRAPPPPLKSRIALVKVIASSLRKGNIVDIDGKLYVVLTAENFHPGKGTPTTQVDMRRISDGVKTSQRYKTTDQVERAHVEDHEFSYLYKDGDGFHFMNSETYDQVQVPADVVGDYEKYLQEGMVVSLALHEGVAVSIEIPQKVTLEITDTEPAMKGQTASGSFKPAMLSNGVRTMVPTHITTGTRVVVTTADGSYVERAKD